MDSQYQGELFKDGVGSNQKPLFKLRPAHFIRLKRISLTYEVFFSLIIAFLLALIIAYTVGVERGKTLALKNMGMSEAKPRIKKIKMSPVEVDTKQKISSLEAAQGAPPAKPATVSKASSPVAAQETAPQGGYYIQAASFRDKASAQEALQKLASTLHAPGYLGSGNNYYALFVGPCKTSDEAGNMLVKVKKYYKDAFIKKIK